MTVFGPDGRAWTIVRTPAAPGALPSFLRGGAWVVEATGAEGETRRWSAASRRVAGSLVTQIALAIRTGAAGPPGELSGELADDAPAVPRSDEVS